MEQQHDDFEDLLGDNAHSGPAAKNSGPLTGDSPSQRPDDPPVKRKVAPGAAPAPLPESVSAEQLAQLLGLTTGRVYELARTGIVPRNGRSYPLPDAVRAYAEYVRANPVGRKPKDLTGTEGDLAAEKLRLAREQADALELKNAAARGELVKASQVEKEWADVLRDVRAAMLAVPSRVGAVCPHLSKTDLAEFDRQIRNALEGLADGT